MSRLLTRAFILEKYGPRLSMDQLSEILGIPKTTLYTKKSQQTLGIDTYTDCGRCFADYEEVARYLDLKSQEAKAALLGG